jgi:hypothetical protein
MKGETHGIVSHESRNDRIGRSMPTVCPPSTSTQDKLGGNAIRAEAELDMLFKTPLPD